MPDSSAGTNGTGRWVLAGGPPVTEAVELVARDLLPLRQHLHLLHQRRQQWNPKLLRKTPFQSLRRKFVTGKKETASAEYAPLPPFCRIP